MDRVNKLDAATSSHVRSGFTIPSFGQCIEELVTNSVDAGARNVTCEFNVHKFYSKVTDDGHGFMKNNLEKAGM